MGMYTELILGCRLSKDAPKILTDSLDYVINGKEDDLVSEEVKDFVVKYDLGYLCHSASYYFGQCLPTSLFCYDKISKQWVLSIRSNLKNYEGQIENFLDYISEYVTKGSGYENEIYAYVQYEEDAFPTIYSKEGIFKITQTERI